jgi:hypothetical protein
MTIDEFKAAVGANPLTNTSGGQKKTRIARKGYKPARTKLHVWTMTLLNPRTAPNPVYDYFHGADNRSVYSARNKLARVLWGIARDMTLDAPPLVPAADDTTAVPTGDETATPLKPKTTKRAKRG